MVSAPLMFGTSSCRVPSFFCMSMARPRLMWAGVIWLGLPSTGSKPTFSSGMASSALTRAKPMRWVNETLPPRARERWLLMTIRLSQRSLTGTERTEVAVGTDSESSMFATVRAGAPRRTVYVGWSAAADGAGSFFSLGTGRLVPLAGSAALLSGRGVARGAGRPSPAGTLGALVVPESWGRPGAFAGGGVGADVGAGAAVGVEVAADGAVSRVVVPFLPFEGAPFAPPVLK